MAGRDRNRRLSRPGQAPLASLNLLIPLDFSRMPQISLRAVSARALSQRPWGIPPGGDPNPQNPVFRRSCFRRGPCGHAKRQIRRGKASHDHRSEQSARKTGEIRPSADRRPELLLRRLRQGRAAAPAAWRSRFDRYVRADPAEARRASHGDRRRPAGTRPDRAGRSPVQPAGEWRRHGRHRQNARLRQGRCHGLFAGGRRRFPHGGPASRGGASSGPDIDRLRPPTASTTRCARSRRK
jgi:hypothetical protein